MARRENERDYDEDDSPRRGNKSSKSPNKRKHKESQGEFTPILLGVLAFVGVVGLVGGGIYWLKNKKVADAGANQASTTNDANKSPTAGPNKTNQAKGLNQTAPQDLPGAIAEADKLDPGWRLEQLLASRKEVPEAENGARVVQDAFKLVPMRRPAEPTFLRNLVGNQRLSAQQKIQLTQWFAPNEAAYRAALELVTRPRGKFDLNIKSNDPEILLPDEQNTHVLGSILLAGALIRAESGAPGKLEDFRSLAHLASILADEPITISQLIRTAIQNHAFRSLEHTLSRTTPDGEALTLAQEDLKGLPGPETILTAFRGQRAFQFFLLDGLNSGKWDFNSIVKMFTGGELALVLPADEQPGTPKLGSAIAMDLNAHTEFVEITKKPLHQQAAALASAISQFRDKRQSNPFAIFKIAPMYDSAPLDKLHQALMRSEASRRCAEVAVALERSRLKTGKWPKELKEIDSSLLAAIPTDPFDGAPLRLRVLDDGVVVYSVGPNGRDDSGDLGDRGENSRDFGFRLWDPEKRK